MPQLWNVGRPLQRLITRWRAVSRHGSRARIDEMASWIQPTVRADRDWDVDERQIWGYTGDQGNLGQNFAFPAIAIFAGRNEVHVRKIDFKIQRDDGLGIFGREVNVLTPDSSYVAPEIGAGEFYPFLQTTPIAQTTAPLSLPQADVIGGYSLSLYSVTINGVPINPAIGPRYTQRMDATGGIAAFANQRMETILDWNDPALILPPFRQLAVQFFNPATSVPIDERLFVNFYFSEREVA